MATHPNADKHGAQLLTAAPSSITSIARVILAPLASLKVTVGLLGLSVFVIWIITLEQVTVDIWALKNKHFNSLFVYVPLMTFFPRNWFPDMTAIPGGIVLPTGLTLIGGMLINLTAAHLLRFRVQAQGLRLGLGIIVLVSSAALTWAIIFNGQDADGFQGQPPIPWKQMWTLMQIGVLGLAIGAAVVAFNFESKRKVERILMSLMAVTLAGLLAISLVLGESAFIGNSAMRILWQLIQATMAAVVTWAGCFMLFKRKAGIVLLHLGIAGLLVNEIYVTITNEEHRVSFAEGETVHHAVDLRETELVFINRSDSEFDEMSVLPSRFFTTGGDVIDHPDLPFKVRCLEYMKNSDVIRVGPNADNRANTGIGEVYLAVATKAAAGADANAGADQASSYVELIDRDTDESVGIFMVSQAAYERDLLDTVRAGDTEYHIGLRFKTVYKPYAIKLNDTTAKHYVGTEVPSWFSSDFEISDAENGTTDQRIWMNNPLRYRDETFYQTTYNKVDQTEYSGIQIVRNKGWMIPYICCMFVVVGLVAQFQLSLSGYLSKTNKSTPGSSDNQQVASTSWLPTWILLGVCGLYLVPLAARSITPEVAKSKGSEIRLDLLGQLPVTFEGRVQPLDSYARNLARELSNRETVKDGLGFKQPAIRWLADTIFGSSRAAEYEILRIEDLNVQNALGLPRRKGLKYKFSEIRAANRKLIDLLIESDDLPPEQLTVFHKRLREVFSKSRLIIGIEAAFNGTAGRVDPNDTLERLDVAASLTEPKTKATMPFAVPTGDAQDPFMPLAIAVEQKWLYDTAKEIGDFTVSGLTSHLLNTEIERLKPGFIKEKIIRDMLQYEDIVDGLLKKFKLNDRSELAESLSQNWHLIPREMYEKEWQSAAEFVDMQLVRLRVEQAESIEGLVREINGPKRESIRQPDQRFVENLLVLKQAYLDDDADTFNAALERHWGTIEDDAPSQWSALSHRMELSYNAFSPFYVASLLYVFGFMITLFSWVGWRQPLNRAAFFIIALALTIHVVGIIARVMISGRPPITNLYSSFVVVAAGCVLMLMIIERMTRLGIGNILAGASGFLTLLYAWTLSVGQGDTFTVLRAVLDTQFWLTTHVIIINLGYSATLVAGLVGVIFFFVLLFSKGMGAADKRAFSNIIYGVVCFALLFSFFGTVLGGLWADDSWGRFWGWDPKENGALMIVLWNALILHARWAGMIRERGLAGLAAIGNVITVWSWEGVNQLGVGLHAYGGTGGAAAGGSIFYDPIFYLQLFAAVHILLAVLTLVLPTSLYRGLNSRAKVPVANLA